MIIKYFRWRHQKHYKNSRFHLIADILFVVIILALMVAFFMIRFWEPEPIIELQAKLLNDKVISGGLQVLELEYKTHKPTTNNSLVLELPDNFILETVEPANNFNRDTHTLYLDDLDEGDKGKIKISGYVLGEINKDQLFGFIFNCTECGNGVLSSLPYTINESALIGELVFSERVYQGVPANGQLKLRNDGGQDLENVKFKFSDQFVISVNDQLLKDNELILGQISKGQALVVDFKAKTMINEAKAQLRVGGYLDLNGENLKQIDLSREVGVKAPNFKVLIQPDKAVAKYSDTLTYSLNFKNQESDPLKNLQFKFSAGNPSYQINKLELVSAPKNIELKDGTLRVTKDFAPEENGQAILLVSYKRLQSELNSELSLNAQIQYGINDQSLTYDILSNKTKVLSEIKIRSGAYYYSSQGDQLGVGPLPPVVDMATNYWVFWEIENLGNDLTNLRIVGDVLDEVVWTDNKSLLAGDLKHAEIGGRVIWEVPEISSDTHQSRYRVGFELGVIPTVEEVGKVLELVKNISYTVHDKFCDQEISGSLRTLDTNLEADMLANGKGQVVISE